MNKARALTAAAATLIVGAIGCLGTAPAFAADTTTITLNNAHPGEQFQAFKLLNATSAMVDDKQAVAYTLYAANGQEAVPERTVDYIEGAINEDEYEFPAPLVEGVNARDGKRVRFDFAEPDVPNYQAINDKAINTYLSHLTSEADHTGSLRTFTNLLQLYINRTKKPLEESSPNWKETCAEGASSVTFNVEPGYYFVQQLGGDATPREPSSTERPMFSANFPSAAMLVTTTADKPAVVTLKNSYTNYTKALKFNGIWGSNGTYAIGEDIQYSLLVRIPEEFNTSDSYPITFTDLQTAGLEIIGTPILEYVTTDSSTGKSTYTPLPVGAPDSDAPIRYSGQHAIDNPDDEYVNTFTITIDDAKRITLPNGEPLRRASLRVSYTARLTEDLPETNVALNAFAPTLNGHTLKKFIVKAQTVNYHLDKFFEGGAPDDDDLPVFELFKDGESLGEHSIEVVDDGYALDYKGLGVGDYTIKEKHAGAGWNQAADQHFTVYQDDDGNVQVRDTDDKHTATDIAVGEHNTIAHGIVNTTGSELPETGGIGTTMLYIAAAAIIALSGIGLATMLRKRNKD